MSTECNIFRAVRLTRAEGPEGVLFDHCVEIVSPCCPNHPLEDTAVKGAVLFWCRDNVAQFALGRDNTLWFAQEDDAIMFFLMFS